MTQLSKETIAMFEALDTITLKTVIRCVVRNFGNPGIHAQHVKVLELCSEKHIINITMTDGNKIKYNYLTKELPVNFYLSSDEANKRLKEIEAIEIEELQKQVNELQDKINKKKATFNL